MNMYVREPDKVDIQTYSRKKKIDHLGSDVTVFRGARGQESFTAPPGSKHEVRVTPEILSKHYM